LHPALSEGGGRRMRAIADATNSLLLPRGPFLGGKKKATRINFFRSRREPKFSISEKDDHLLSHGEGGGKFAIPPERKGLIPLLSLSKGRAVLDRGVRG